MMSPGTRRRWLVVTLLTGIITGILNGVLARAGGDTAAKAIIVGFTMLMATVPSSLALITFASPTMVARNSEPPGQPQQVPAQPNQNIGCT